MNVNLTPRLEKFVHKKVDSGRYNSASEVVREALRLMEEHEKVRITQLAALRKRVDDGLASLNRGESVDGEKFMARLISDLDTRQARHKSR